MTKPEVLCDQTSCADCSRSLAPHTMVKQFTLHRVFTRKTGAGC